MVAEPPFTGVTADLNLDYFLINFRVSNTLFLSKEVADQTQI